MVVFDEWDLAVAVFGVVAFGNHEQMCPIGGTVVGENDTESE